VIINVEKRMVEDEGVLNQKKSVPLLMTTSINELAEQTMYVVQLGKKKPRKNKFLTDSGKIVVGAEYATRDA